VLARMGEVVFEVALGRDHGHVLLHRVANGPRLGLPDRPLGGIVLTVEVPGVGKVAVVGHVEVMAAGPDEGADHHLREEEAVVVAGLDAGETDVGRHADDADTVAGGRYGSGGMGAVAVVVLPGAGVLVGSAALAGGAVGDV